MKKINLKGISEILSEKELKNVMGGSSSTCTTCNKQSDCSGSQICAKVQGRCYDQYFCW